MPGEVHGGRGLWPAPPGVHTDRLRLPAATGTVGCLHWQAGAAPPRESAESAGGAIPTAALLVCPESGGGCGHLRASGPWIPAAGHLALSSVDPLDTRDPMGVRVRVQIFTRKASRVQGHFCVRVFSRADTPFTCTLPDRLPSLAAANVTAPKQRKSSRPGHDGR